MPRIDLEKFNPGPVGANQAAVVFVHGFTGDRRGTWGRIPDFLAADQRLRGWDLFGFGYQSRRRFDLLGLWSADARLEEIAIKLTSALEIGRRNYESVAFVAHSMGGLVVQRALVSSAALRRRTTHLFLFGTPSAGLVKATLLSGLKQQVRNMSASGEFVTRLRSDWKRLNLAAAPPFKFLATAGETDQFVPPSSSLGPFPKEFRRVIPGNHISMLNVSSANDPCIQILVQGLTDGAALAGPRNSARVAVEAGEFHEAIDRLWPGRKNLDDGGAVQLAIALEGAGRRQDAIEVLRLHKPQGTDVLGVLAGCLKRRWQVTRDAADFESARQMYQHGYEAASSQDPPDHGQAQYHGINLAYLALAGSQRNEAAARELAARSLEHAAMAANPQDRHWRLASAADALLILDRADAAYDLHRQIVASDPDPWVALSIEEQSLRVAEQCGFTKAQARKLAAIYEEGETPAAVDPQTSGIPAAGPTKGL